MTHFTEAVSELEMKRMAQISMDGPNVNWKFLGIMQQKLNDDFQSSAVNIGSCGLHIVHNSFKGGATASSWEIGKYNKYNIFRFLQVKI